MELIKAKALVKYIDAVISKQQQEKNSPFIDDGLQKMVRDLAETDFSGQSPIRVTLREKLLKQIQADNEALDDADLDNVAGGLNHNMDRNKPQKPDDGGV